MSWLIGQPTSAAAVRIDWLVKPFGVEQQAVHVEDDGRRRAGKAHGRRAAISALASSTKPAPDRAVVIQRGR